MNDLSDKIAETIYTGKISVDISGNDRGPRVVKLIREIHPEATMEEIMHGFLISIELIEQEKEELKKENADLKQEMAELMSKLR